MNLYTYKILFKVSITCTGSVPFSLVTVTLFAVSIRLYKLPSSTCVGRAAASETPNDTFTCQCTPTPAQQPEVHKCSLIRTTHRAYAVTHLYETMTLWRDIGNYTGQLKHPSDAKTLSS
jgi:hypothetical protein